jgi:hypothetical protein
VHILSLGHLNFVEIVVVRTSHSQEYDRSFEIESGSVSKSSPRQISDLGVGRVIVQT